MGSSGKSAEDFFALLAENSVKKLMDIRLNNRSQLAGFTNLKHLPYFLKIHHIDYAHEPLLAPTKELMDGYKKKKLSWAEYEKRFKHILEQRDILKNIPWDAFNDAVLLCSEATPEYCHRRLVAEFLLKANKNIELRHL